MKNIQSPRLKAFILFTFLFLVILGAVLIYDKYTDEVQSSSGLEPANSGSLISPEEEDEDGSASESESPSQSQSALNRLANLVKKPLSSASEAKTAKSKPYVYKPLKLSEIVMLFKAEPLEQAPEVNSEDDFLPLLNTVPMRADGAVIGIRNRGNSCYADSVLQMLFRIPIIRKIIANLHVYYPRIKTEVDRLEEEAKAIFAIQKTKESVSSLEFKRETLIKAVQALEGINHIFHQLQVNEVSNPAKFSVNKSVRSLPGHYFDNRQEDAEEYFGTIVDMINDFLPPKQRHHLIIVCTLSGSHRSIGIEPEQTKEYSGTEPVTRLPLHMSKRSTSLMKMMREYFAPEKKDLKFDYDNGIEGEVTQTRKLSTLPEILPIQLQRRQYDSKSDASFKLSHDVFVPVILDLKDFLEDQSLDARYALKMFVRHSGGANGGHYVSYTLDSEGHWNCINDDVVSRRDKKSPDAMTLSYFYFYQRILPGDPEPDLSLLSVEERAMLDANGLEDKNSVISAETKRNEEQRAATKKKVEQAKKKAGQRSLAYVYNPLQMPEMGPLLFKAEPVAEELNFDADFLPHLKTVPMRQDSVIVGIANRGNSGYASSILQALFRNPLIRKIIANLDVYYPQIKAEVDRLEMMAKAVLATEKTKESISAIEFKRETLIKAVQTLEGINHVFHQLQENSADQSAEYSVTRSLQSLPGHFAAKEKEDADEYFGTILGMINEILPPQQRHHLEIACSLKGIHKSVRVDPQLTKPYSGTETFSRLSLVIPKKARTLSKLLSNYFAVERKELKFDAEHGGYVNQARKLTALPETLTLQIQRKRYYYETGKQFKLKQTVTVPLHLDLNDFLEDQSLEAKYALKMFVRHAGIAEDDGLYTIYSLEPNGSWYHIDNDQVIKLGKELPEEAQASYMYFYQKITDHETNSSGNVE